MLRADKIAHCTGGKCQDARRIAIPVELSSQSVLGKIYNSNTYTHLMALTFDGSNTVLLGL